jgi:SAM-dependent methyltransferase
MDKSRYECARILDMGCGDGRNLPLLLNLGFEVHACELDNDMVSALEAFASRANWAVQFKVGVNHELPYPEAYFDYMLCCASCYYLDDSKTWSQVRTELARVLKPGGVVVANFCDDDNFLLKNAIRQADGSLLITSDPYNLRNGIRFVSASSEAEVIQLISPDFNLKGLAHLRDDFYGVHVSGPVVVAQKI